MYLTPATYVLPVGMGINPLYFGFYLLRAITYLMPTEKVIESLSFVFFLMRDFIRGRRSWF